LSRRLELGSHVSYLDWEVNGATEPLRDQPHWQSGGMLSWKPSRRWHSRIDALWVGRRYDFSVPVPNQTTVGGYSTTNAVTTYEWSSSVSSFLRADNLFNAHFHEFIGFPNPGIWIRCGVEVHLK
jgi:outer membrane cobalamin receptor